MIRTSILALAITALSACSYGSAVDIAPMKERLPLMGETGSEYCEVKGERAPFTIGSGSCGPVVWSEATRTYDFEFQDPDRPDKPADRYQLAFVHLNGALFAVSTEYPNRAGAKDRYELNVVIRSGDAVALLRPLDDSLLTFYAGQQDKLTFRQAPIGRLYIAAGAPADIKTFLAETAGASIYTMRQSKSGLSIVIRNEAGAGSRTLNAAQVKDIEAVLAIANALAPPPS